MSMSERAAEYYRRQGLTALAERIASNKNDKPGPWVPEHIIPIVRRICRRCRMIWRIEEHCPVCHAATEPTRIFNGG